MTPRRSPLARALRKARPGPATLRVRSSRGVCRLGPAHDCGRCELLSSQIRLGARVRILTSHFNCDTRRPTAATFRRTRVGPAAAPGPVRWATLVLFLGTPWIPGRARPDEVRGDPRARSVLSPLFLDEPGAGPPRSRLGHRSAHRYRGSVIGLVTGGCGMKGGLCTTNIHSPTLVGRDEQANGQPWHQPGCPWQTKGAPGVGGAFLDAFCKRV